MPHAPYKPTAQRSAFVRSAADSNIGQRKALRHSPVGQACGSGLTTRLGRSGFTLDKPQTLRRISLLNE